MADPSFDLVGDRLGRAENTEGMRDVQPGLVNTERFDFGGVVQEDFIDFCILVFPIITYNNNQLRADSFCFPYSLTCLNPLGPCLIGAGGDYRSAMAADNGYRFAAQDGVSLLLNRGKKRTSCSRAKLFGAWS